MRHAFGLQGGNVGRHDGSRIAGISAQSTGAQDRARPRGSILAPRTTSPRRWSPAYCTGPRRARLGPLGGEGDNVAPNAVILATASSDRRGRDPRRPGRHCDHAGLRLLGGASTARGGEPHLAHGVCDTGHAQPSTSLQACRCSNSRMIGRTAACADGLPGSRPRQECPRWRSGPETDRSCRRLGWEPRVRGRLATRA